MRCPRCPNVHLVAEEFRGEFIEVCPSCDGVWLTREDFNRLLAKADAEPALQPQQRRPRDQERRDDYYRDDRRRDRDYDHRYDRRTSDDSSARLPAQGRRRSWLHGLSDLFD